MWQKTMYRTKNPEKVNEIINHPEVFPHVTPYKVDKIDVTNIVLDTNNIVYIGDNGCFIFIKHDEDRYEVHSQFTPEGRGKKAVIAARECSKDMFLGTECLELVTKVPVDNKAAKGLALLMGFEKQFHRDKAWGDMGVDYYSLSFEKWLSMNRWLEKSGEWFHKQLGEEHVLHDHDPEHDLRVGAAVEMCKLGLPFKAEWLYNRWAKFAGYSEIEIINTDPLTIDIKDSIIRFVDNKIEVLKCQ